jgi:hypothetical protein
MVILLVVKLWMPFDLLHYNPCYTLIPLKLTIIYW